MGLLLATVLAGVAAVLGAVVVAWRRFFLSPLRAVPGPALAAVTRLWHVRHVVRGDQAPVLVGAHDRYGPFVRIAPNEVSVGHPEALRKILLAPLHKADWYKVAVFPDGRFLNPFAATDPRVKAALSRHVAPGYAMSAVLRSEPAVDATVGLLLDWLDGFAASRAAVRLDEFLNFTAADLVGEVVFSQPFGFLRKGADIAGALAVSEAQSAYVSAVGFFRWIHVVLLANPVVASLGIVPWGHIVDTAMAAIRRRQERADAGEGRFDVAAHWFRALAANPDTMQRHEIDSAAFQAVAAGADTVASALQAFVYCAQRHRDAWPRLRREMRDAGLAAKQDRVVAYADAQKLPLLQACLKEALRMFGPGSMGLPRVAPPGGLKIGATTFPAGTVLSVHPWVIHQSKEIWGPDAREFNPDRWLGPDAARLERYLMPFGLGYASCPGQHLARMEMAKICATLVRDYDFRPVDPAAEMRYKSFFSLIAHIPPQYVEKV